MLAISPAPEMLLAPDRQALVLLALGGLLVLAATLWAIRSRRSRLRRKAPVRCHYIAPPPA
jgi:hypothetical protein